MAHIPKQLSTTSRSIRPRMQSRSRTSARTGGVGDVAIGGDITGAGGTGVPVITGVAATGGAVTGVVVTGGENQFSAAIAS
jgi:hypothetical protein